MLLRRLSAAAGGGGNGDDDKTGPMMWVGVALLFVSLSFDGATGAYEDEIMLAGHLGPFELMYNIQFGKMVIAFLCLLFFNEVNYFFDNNIAAPVDRSNADNARRNTAKVNL